MLDNKSILGQINLRKAEIKRFGVQKIGLFGSYARSSQTHGSDIDIMVEFTPGMKSFDNYMGLKIFLEELFGAKVDLVISDAVKKRLRQYIFEGLQYAGL